MTGCNRLDQSNNDESCARQYSDYRSSQQVVHGNISDQNQTNGSRDGVDSTSDGVHELMNMNDMVGFHESQSMRRSVAFSIGTIVVQGPNNNGQIVKGDHKILQVTDKKLQQCQEAV
jgi:hypothetical protein